MDLTGNSLLSKKAIGALCVLILLGTAVVGVAGRSELSPVEAAYAVAKSPEPAKTFLDVLQGRTPEDLAAVRLVNIKAKSVPSPDLEQLGMGRGRNRLIPRRPALAGPLNSAQTETFAQLQPTDLLEAPNALVSAPGLGDLGGLVLPAAELGAQSPPAGGGLTFASPIVSLGDIAEVSPPSATPTSEPTTPVTAVPEPATWGLMLIGFLFVGIGLRRRVRPYNQAIEER